MLVRHVLGEEVLSGETSRQVTLEDGERRRHQMRTDRAAIGLSAGMTTPGKRFFFGFEFRVMLNGFTGGIGHSCLVVQL